MEKSEVKFSISFLFCRNDTTLSSTGLSILEYAKKSLEFNGISSS